MPAMKFVDEAFIQVSAGHGGDGCLSFRREKFIPRGGPNGGDGGRGGSVFLRGDKAINTLIDFQYKRIFEAENGQPGEGQERTGRYGEDLYIPVPLGTEVHDRDTGELLGDLQEDQGPLKVAQGGRRGLGNIHFKSSTNRAPRKTTKGDPGEERRLHLELKVLADVGLLGWPNAGKSTLIRALSASRSKVSDYPFTTLRPYLGVVSVSSDRSFVIADIPGIIEGASEGAGLGIQFLKHVARTRVLLHVVDMMPLDESDPVEAIRQIEGELKKFSVELANKPRWLVLNKADLIPDVQEREKRRKDIVKRLKWKGPVFVISAISKMGTKELVYAIAQALEV